MIASAPTDTSYVSHRSAFEYYGYTNQVSYDVSVTSTQKFNSLISAATAVPYSSGYNDRNRYSTDGVRITTRNEPNRLYKQP